MIFQGQELLEDEWFRDTDPIDWSKKETFRGIFHIYRDLIRLRRNWYDTTRGLRGQNVNVFHVNDHDKLIAYHRWDQGGPRDDVVVVVNMANRAYESYTIGFPREGQWKVRFNSDWRGYSDDFGDQPGYDTVASAGYKDGLRYHGNIGIGPYSALILSRD
jgi:1,4-alpha-glucan branching enzyme